MVNRMKVGVRFREWKAIFLAQWCESFGNIWESIEHYEEALVFRTVLNPNPNAMQASLLLSLGRVQRAAGLNDEAVLICSKAFEIAQAVSHEASLEQALCLYELSFALAESGCKLGAQRNMVRAERIIDVSPQRTSSQHVAILHALINLFKDERCNIQPQLERWALRAQIIADAINNTSELRLSSPWHSL